MNSRDQVIDQLAKQMSDEIDREIMWGMLKDIGWHRVNLDRFIDRKHSVDIVNWLHDNCKHPYEKSGCHFIFQDAGDAVNFIFNWKSN